MTMLLFIYQETLNMSKLSLWMNVMFYLNRSCAVLLPQETWWQWPYNLTNTLPPEHFYRPGVCNGLLLWSTTASVDLLQVWGFGLHCSPKPQTCNKFYLSEKKNEVREVFKWTVFYVYSTHLEMRHTRKAKVEIHLEIKKSMLFSVIQPCHQISCLFWAASLPDIVWFAFKSNALLQSVHPKLWWKWNNSSLGFIACITFRRALQFSGHWCNGTQSELKKLLIFKCKWWKIPYYFTKTSAEESQH